MRTLRPCTRLRSAFSPSAKSFSGAIDTMRPAAARQQRVQHRHALRVVESAHRIVVAIDAPHQRGAAIAGFGQRIRAQRQQRQRAVACEAFEGARRRAAVQRDAADPGGLAVVALQRLAHLLAEHAPFGDHRQVETLGDAGIQLHRVRQRLQRFDTAWRSGCAGGSGRRSPRRASRAAAAPPGGRSRAPHRASAPLRRRRECSTSRRVAAPAAGPARQPRRRLRHVHLHDRLRIGGGPAVQPLQQLHAAHRQRQGARVGADIVVGARGCRTG